MSLLLFTFYLDLPFKDTRIRKRQHGVEEEVLTPTVITDYKNGIFGKDQWIKVCQFFL